MQFRNSVFCNKLLCKKAIYLFLFFIIIQNMGHESFNYYFNHNFTGNL